MRYLISSLAVLCLAVAAQAQTDHPHDQHKSAKQGDACKCPMKHQEIKHRQEHARGTAMRRPEEMRLRMRMMMKTRINADDPAAILSLKEPLKLNELQVHQLQKIAEQARKAAREVLNGDQRHELAAVPGQPDTGMAMRRMMMHRMIEHTQARLKGDHQPMMMSNMPSHIKAEGEQGHEHAGERGHQNAEHGHAHGDFGRGDND